MDNLTHSLCGWALVRAGWRRAPPWAVPVALVASNLPDADVLFTGWLDKPQYLTHHRGLSHSLLGLAAQALVVALAAVVAGRRWARWRATPPRFLPALAVAATAGLAHVFLDYLTTYGVRPWLPFDGTWWYGDVLFVVDPWLLWLLAAAVFVAQPWTPAARRGWRAAAGVVSVVFACAWARDLVAGGAAAAAAALWLASGLWAFLAQRDVTHPRAVRAFAALAACYLALLAIGSHAARAQVRERLAAPPGELTLAVAPEPAVPWRFTVLAADAREVRVFRVNLLRGEATNGPCVERHLDDPALAEVNATAEGRAWRLFARLPVLERHGTEVILGDARYRTLAMRDWSALRVRLSATAPPPARP